MRGDYEKPLSVWLRIGSRVEPIPLGEWQLHHGSGCKGLPWRAGSNERNQGLGDRVHRRFAQLVGIASLPAQGGGHRAATGVSVCLDRRHWRDTESPVPEAVHDVDPARTGARCFPFWECPHEESVAVRPGLAQAAARVPAR